MNLYLEYALASNPNIPSVAGLPVLSGNSFSFFRARTDVTYTVEVSTDMRTWTSLVVNTGTVGQMVTVNVPTTGPQFVRLKVTSS